MLGLLAFLLALVSSIEARISCKALDGSSVDWFVVYKLPQGLKDGNTGKEIMYADANNPSWTLSKRTIDDERSPIGLTLAQVYRNDPSAFSVAWSDDGPHSKPEGYRGHTKGVLLFDHSTGFWLSHSVPNFPPTKAWSYPASGVRFAQTFMCLTVPTDILGDIAEHLRLMQATPFAHNLPDRFASRFPGLRMVIDKTAIPKTSKTFASVKHLKTADGTSFVSAAKHKKFNKDVWADLVAADSGASLAVQTWLNGGADDLHSSCRTKAKVYDVQTIRVLGTSFKSARDHSKWGVSKTQSIPITCVGDLNRQKSQLSRGGGVLCIQDARLWKTFYDTVEQIEQCSNAGIQNLFAYTLLVPFALLFIMHQNRPVY